MYRRSALGLIGSVPFLGARDAFAQAAPGKTLTYGQSTRVTALDPAQGAFATYPGGYEVGYCLFDRLVDFDADLKIVPQLATSWEIAPDVKSVRFKLRAGVKFQDGANFDAAAVKFNVERLMDRERTPTNRPLWDVVGAVEIVDESTVIVRTKDAFSQILNSFAHGSGSMVSPASVAKHGEKGVAQNPVGAGPFMLESFTPGQEVALKVDAFPFQRHGMLTGSLRAVGAESFGANEGGGGTSSYTPPIPGGYHRSQIELTNATLRGIADKSNLIAGMTLTAEIKVGSRSVISYFLYPIRRGLSESLREP